MYSRTEPARLSIPPGRIKLFLERFANLDTSNERQTRLFIVRFTDLLPYPVRPAAARGLNEVESTIQRWLQEIWREPSRFLKEARLMVLAGYEQRYQVHKSAEEGGRFEFTPFLSVLLYALKHAPLLRYCGNPECKEPFFVAQRGSQTYCGPDCAKLAQKEAKLKWWNEHGTERRKKSGGKKRKYAKAT